MRDLADRLQSICVEVVSPAVPRAEINEKLAISGPSG